MTSRIARASVSYVRDTTNVSVSDRLTSPLAHVNAPVIEPPVMSARAERQAARFWARVNKAGPVNSRRPELGPCWIWTGAQQGRPDRNGQLYGQSSYAGQVMGAHRAAFLMHGGVIPSGHDVMHLCDTKACVRRDHLKAGTRSENLLDGFAAAANFGVCAGENNGRARLTWDQVHAIRAAGAKQADLSRQYGVSQVQISHIVRGTRWPEAKCPVHGDAPFRKAAAA